MSEQSRWNKSFGVPLPVFSKPGVGGLPVFNEPVDINDTPAEEIKKNLCNSCGHRPETKCMLNKQIMKPNDHCSQHTGN